MSKNHATSWFVCEHRQRPRRAFARAGFFGTCGSLVHSAVHAGHARHAGPEREVNKERAHSHGSEFPWYFRFKKRRKQDEAALALGQQVLRLFGVACDERLEFVEQVTGLEGAGVMATPARDCKRKRPLTRI